MSDSQRRLPSPASSNLPARTPPRSSVPALPSTGGAVLFGGDLAQVRADRRFVDAHTELLRSQSAQALAACELVDNRHALAIAVSKLSTLPEICDHEYQRGRLERISEITQLRLKLQTEEVQAQARLLAAQLDLAALTQTAAPTSSTPTAPQHAPGLAPDEVDEVLSNFPELTPDMRRTILLTLSGRLNEKSKDKP